MRLLAAAMLAALVALSATADEIILKSGKKVTGVKVTGEAGKYVIFVKGGKKYGVPKSKVAKVVRDGGGSTTSGGSGEGEDTSGWAGKARTSTKGQYKKVPIEFVITATYHGDAPRKFLEAFGQRVIKGSEFMWETTEGQMYVKQVTVIDNKNNGTLRIKNLDSRKIGAPYARAFPGSHIDVGGLMLAYTFTHEMFHLKFRLPDEYAPRCERCIMSANPRSIYLCTDSCHTGSGKSCWARMKRICPALRIPAPGPTGRRIYKKRKLPKCPKTKVLIQDSGKAR